MLQSKLTPGGLKEVLITLKQLKTVNLNTESCSLGRAWDDNTNNFHYYPNCAKVLGEHCSFLGSLDASYNDLSAPHVSAFVGAWAPAQQPQETRLRTLTLNGNTIGSDGVETLVKWVKDSCPLTTMNLIDCGVTERGAEALVRLLADGKSTSLALSSLDLRDNDVGPVTRDLAEAAQGLERFNSIPIAELRGAVEPKQEPRLLSYPQQKLMAHGILALLLALKEGCQTSAPCAALPSLELQNTQLLGYHLDRPEAIDEICELLSAGQITHLE